MDLSDLEGEPDSPDLPDIDSIASLFLGEGEAPPAEAAPASATAPPPEAPAAAPASPQVPAQDPREVRGIEMLATREKALRAEQEAFRAEREAYQEQLAEYRRVRQMIEREDALGGLQALGLDFDRVSAAVLAGTGVSPTTALEETLTGRMTEAEARLQAQVDALAAARYEADMETFRVTTRSVVERAAPVLASAFGADAVEVVRGRYEKLAEDQRHRGENVSLPPIEDVIRDLESETLDFVSRLKDTPAVRALFGQPAKPQDASPTLRNAHVASAPTRKTEIDTDDLEGEALIEALARKHFPA